MVFRLSVMVLLWIATLVRLPTLWRGRRQRALWTALFALALVKSASFPPFADRLPTTVAPSLLGVVAAFCLLRFIALVTGGQGRRWQAAVAGAVLVTLAVLAAVAGGHVDNSGDVLSRPLPAVAVAYWVVLETYVGAVLVTASRLFWTVGRAAPAGPPRLGLRAIAAGTAVVSLYAATKSVLIVIHGFGVPIAFGRIEPVAHVVQATAILVAVAGGLVPAIGRARAVVGTYRNLLRLRPLWRAMRDAFPEVILFSPRQAVIELAGADDVDLRLYRRVIEIRDGMLALRSYRPGDRLPGDELAGDGLLGDRLPGDGLPGDGLPGDGLPGDGLLGDGLPGPEVPVRDPAVVEAVGIARALRRRAEGAEPHDQPEAWAPVGPDMADEVAWLTRVSTAFRDLSPEAVPTPRPSGSVR